MSSHQNLSRLFSKQQQQPKSKYSRRDSFAPQRRVQGAGLGGKSHPDDSKIHRLPPLKNAKKDNVDQLLIQKLEQCCIIYDFDDESSNMRGKEMKAATLSELMDYFSAKGYSTSECLYPVVFRMVAVNIFRCFPKDSVQDMDMDEAAYEISWPHLRLVYEFFVKFLDSLHNEQLPVAVNYANEQFLVDLLGNFDSGDPRERLMAKTVLHRIYGKFLSRRLFIRQHISNYFLRYVYETEEMKGISELLEIFGCIINGFVLPLKPEHVDLLKKVLIPLHIPQTLSLYHSQLCYCITQYLDKDGSLAEEIVLGLLKYWPKTCSTKQVLFLNEIEEIIDIIEGEQFEKIQEPLFKTLAKCASSSNFFVIQRTLLMYNNDYFVTLIEYNCKNIMRVMFPPLYSISKSYWHAGISNLANQILKLYRDMDEELYLNLQRQCDTLENIPQS